MNAGRGTRRPRRRPRRAAATMALAAAALWTAPLAAQDATLSITAVTDSTLDLPRTVAAGLVAVQLTNRADAPLAVQLFAVDEAHSLGEAAREILADRLPRWIVNAGGVGALSTGRSAEVLQLLPAGGYLVVAGRPGEVNVIRPLTVTGPFPDEPATPADDAVVLVNDVGFRMLRIVTRGGREVTVDARQLMQPLPPGRHVIRVENAGRQPHEVAILRADTPQGMRAWADGQALPAGAELAGGVMALPPQRRVWVRVTLPPGNYYLFCSVRHRPGVAGYQTGELTQMVVR